MHGDTKCDTNRAILEVKVYLFIWTSGQWLQVGYDPATGSGTGPVDGRASNLCINGDYLGISYHKVTDNGESWFAGTSKEAGITTC